MFGQAQGVHCRQASGGRKVSFKRHTKLVISLGYFFIQEAIGLLLRATGRAPSPRLVILYYHGIPRIYRCDFANQMQVLSRGAHVLPANYRGPLSCDKPNVAITFDDAYISVAENAL